MKMAEIGLLRRPGAEEVIFFPNVSKMIGRSERVFRHNRVEVAGQIV